MAKYADDGKEKKSKKTHVESVEKTHHRRAEFSRGRSKSLAVLQRSQITIDVHEGINPELSKKEQSLILKEERMLDIMRRGKTADSIPTFEVDHTSIDSQYKTKLEEVITRAKKEYKKNKPEKFANAANKIIQKMHLNYELDIHLPLGLDPALAEGLSDFLHNNYERKFVQNNGHPSTLSQIAASDVESALQSVRGLQGIAGEYKLINNLDILQQTYVLGAHQHSINDAKDTSKYFNKVSGLAEAVLVEFKKQFGEENGPIIANLVWMHYPFAIASSDQAAELCSMMKPGHTPEETLDLNMDTLSKCSICNLIPLKSLLSTPGMNAGFLHRTEIIQTTNGSKTANLFMTLPDAQHLLKDVDALIRYGGKVQPIEKEKSRASSSSPVVAEEKATAVSLDASSEDSREAKKIHGKHSKKVVKQRQSIEQETKQNGLV